MSLTFTQVGPGVMLAGFVGCMGYGTFVQDGPVSWKFPAAMSAWFWGFSLYTMVEEGFTTVWQNHNQNFWGSQVWFDLLYSVALFWFTMLPRAKKVGMNIVPWFFYVCSTASVGGLHMYSRILYLEEQQKYEGYTEQD